MNILRMFVLGGWLAGTLLWPARLWQAGPPPPQSPNSERLVVFEGFLEAEGASSASTGLVIDDLAEKYANKVIFIEYDFDLAISQDRKDRWNAAYVGGEVAPPWTLVDSGYRIHAGYTSAAASFAEHEAMIVDALARPPEADITAVSQRIGNAIRVNVQVTNKSGEDLDGTSFAAVHAIVYEENHIQHTNRFMRAHAAVPINIPAGDTLPKNYVILTPTLTGVDWSKLKTVVLVDYVTDSGAYDMLQASLASPPLVVTPASLFFTAPVGGPDPAAQALELSGSTGSSWSATDTAGWLQVSPATGSVPAQTMASISTAGLRKGVYTGKITFSTGSTVVVPVITAIGDIDWVYLPFVVNP